MKDSVKGGNKLKIFLIVILMIFIVFIGIIGYKFIVIKNMQGKIENYKDIKNFHITKTSYGFNTIVVEETFYKDDNYLVHVKNISENNEKKEIISTKNGNNYFIVGERKVAAMNSMPIHVDDKVYNHLETENFWEFIVGIFSSNISTVKCNDKDCYKIDNFITSEVLFPEQGMCVYIDKETGLIVRLEEGVRNNETGGFYTQVSDYKYEFNTVTDEDLKEPNISEYKIENNNSSNNNEKVNNEDNQKTQQIEFERKFNEAVKNIDTTLFLVDVENYNPQSNEIKISEEKAKEIAQKGFEESAKRISGEGTENKESETVQIKEESPNNYFTRYIYDGDKIYTNIKRKCYVVKRENDIGNGVRILVDATTGLIIGGMAFGD